MAVRAAGWGAVVGFGLAAGALLVQRAMRPRAVQDDEPEPPPPRWVYIRTSEHAAIALAPLLARLARDGALLLGLDCEWRPNRVRGEPANRVALIQLAAPDEPTLLLHIAYFSHVPRELETLLGDPRVVKVGVGISGDRQRLWADFGLVVTATLELAGIACDCGAGRTGHSLKALAAELLGVAMDKSSTLSGSDWQAAELSPAQLAYAALDAEASRDVFLACRERRLVALAAERPGEPVPTALLDLTAPYIDRPAPRSTQRAARASSSSAPCDESSSEPARPASAQSPVSKAPTATSEPFSATYDNCAVQRPSGALMAYCSQSKFDWYLSKGLADRVDEHTIRLRFEPQFPNHDGDAYYVTPKASVCVVCASTDGLQRYHVVPTNYRRHFPLHLRAHASHDVVLLCMRCHPAAERAARAFRERLAADLGVDAFPEISWARGPGRLQSMASALRAELTRAVARPEKRVRLIRLLNEALGTPGDEPPAAEILARLADTTPESLGFRDHAKLVFDAMSLLEPVDTSHCISVAWRQHFIDSLRPEHMPPMWSVSHRDHPHELAVRSRVDEHE